MNSILIYLSNVVPYVLIVLPIYGIFRICYLKKNLKSMYKTWHEIILTILVICFTMILSQTIIPKIEIYNGSIGLAPNIQNFRFNFIPFKILYQTFIEVTKYQNISYFYISFLANILLFLPIGLLLPFAYKKFQKFKNIIKFGLLLSLMIEIIQIILPRATDIDDIILNTLGVVLGYGIFKLIKNTCKNSKDLIEKTEAITILDVIEDENKSLKEKDRKYALITGASSGIGYEMALKLSDIGYNIVAVARNKEKLNNLKKMCKTKVEVLALDLENMENVYKLYEITKEKALDVEIVINNAGFGMFGQFEKTDLDKEISMIDLNIKSLHILTKLYLKEMIKKDRGYILNVASSAAFMPAGPLMSTYYSTKSYVLTLTNSINEELKRKNKEDKYNNSKVTVSSLCLGPTKTNFNKNANIHASVNELDSSYVAEEALKGLFKSKRVIIPGTSNKLLKVFMRFVSDDILIKLNYKVQSKKCR